MSLLDSIADSLPKTSIELAPIIMMDSDGRPTNKPKNCWKWSRLQLGFGWHEGEPPAYLLKSDNSSCKPVK